MILIAIIRFARHVLTDVKLARIMIINVTHAIRPSIALIAQLRTHATVQLVILKSLDKFYAANTIA